MTLTTSNELLLSILFNLPVQLIFPPLTLIFFSSTTEFLKIANLIQWTAKIWQFAGGQRYFRLNSTIC